MNKIERNILKALNKEKYENFPTLIDSGKFNGKHGIIMSKFGKTLDHYFKLQNNKFSLQTTIQIGI